MSALGGAGGAPQAPAPPPPATRTLSVVLREALTRGQDVRMLVAKGLPDSANPLPNAAAYMNVELEGQTVTIPKLAGAGLGGTLTGYAVYVMATPDFLLAVGTVVSSSVAAAIPGAVPIGGVVEWPGATIPSGWLRCDGSAFSASTYPDLATALGSTTLPDHRRRVAVGAGSGSYNLGVTEGLAEASRAPYHHHHLTTTRQTDSQGGHQHGNAGGHQHSSLGGGFFAETGLGLTGAAGTARYVVSNGFSQTDSQGDHTHPAVGGHTHNVTIDNDTSGGNGLDAPAFLVVHFIIRAL